MGKPDFQALVDLHYEDLYRFAFSLARNPSDASDLTQHAFAVFAQKGDQIREAARAKSWLFTTLYREFLRQKNREQRSVPLDALPPEAVETAVEPEIEGESDKREVLALLASLDEEQRAILGLFYLKQNSYKEIAQILGIPMGTVMSRISRAKEALRKKMEASGVWEGIKTGADASHRQQKD